MKTDYKAPAIATITTVTVTAKQNTNKTFSFPL